VTVIRTDREYTPREFLAALEARLEELYVRRDSMQPFLRKGVNKRIRALKKNIQDHKRKYSLRSSPQRSLERSKAILADLADKRRLERARKAEERRIEREKLAGTL
jgi:hypothetical protein